MLLLLAERGRQDVRWQDSVRDKHLTEHDSVRCQHQFQTHLFQRDASLHQFGKMMLTGVLLNYVLRAEGGWSRDMFIADREDLGNLSMFEVHVKRLKDQEVSLT